MMRGAIHFLLAVGFLQAPVLPGPSKIKTTPQYITVSASASVRSVTAGSKVTLFVDVAPNPGIHVYAPGAEAYLPIALSLRLPAEVTADPVAYPESEKITFATEQVAVYRKPFRLTQDVTVAVTALAGSTLTVSGVVDYQACDDVICFKPATLPVAWTFPVN